MQTLFLREHNRLAGQILSQCETLSSDEVYERARRLVIAQLQHIVYSEFLPLLLGNNAIPPYQGFRSDVDPMIANEWGAASYRLGHSMVSDELVFQDAAGSETRVTLSELFFVDSVNSYIGQHGIDDVLSEHDS